jgi:tetratricopeptide (TPR) repeat protein
MRSAAIETASLALCLVASPGLRASAQDERARQLFEQGIELLDSGDHVRARELLRESHRAEPRSSTAFNLAFAEHALGRFLAALELLEELLDERFGPIDGEQRTAAETLRDAAERALATLEVRVEGRTVTVRIDGVDRGRVNAGSSISERVDPGAHSIEAMEGTEVLRRAEARVAPGERARAILRIEPVPPRRDRAPEAEGDGPWWWIALGAGVLAVGAAVTALLLVLPAPLTESPVFGSPATLR